MIEINLPTGNYIFVEVTADAYDFRYKIMPDGAKQLVATVKDSGNNVGICYIRENPIGEIISTTKDITEEQCADIVYHHIVRETKYYSNYLPFYGRDFRDVIDNSFKTAKESFQSLLQANNLNITKNYLIVKKI